MKDIDLISIIIPVYNTPEDTLIRCIDSIKNQIYQNIEILIIDDGSNKKTLDICNEQAKKDERIRVVSQKNSGVSSARNKGLSMANGKYITFVDSDDYIDNNYIFQMHKKIDEYEADIIFSSHKKIYKNKKIIKKVYLANDVLIKNKTKKQFNEYNLDLMGTVWGKLYRTSCIKNKKFQTDLKNGEDIIFNYDIFDNKLSYLYINNPGYNYTINSTSAVRKFNKNMIDEYMKTINIINKKINNCEDSIIKNSYYLWIYTFYRVLLVNYFFSKNNKMSLTKKIKTAKALKKEKIFYESFKYANPSELKNSRKIIFYILKYNMFCLFLFTIKFQR